MLSAVLVVALVKAVISGPRFSLVLTGTVTALLLLASLLLTRRGRQLERQLGEP
jgi:hypothetical protein